MKTLIENNHLSTIGSNDIISLCSPEHESSTEPVTISYKNIYSSFSSIPKLELNFELTFEHSQFHDNCFFMGVFNKAVTFSNCNFKRLEIVASIFKGKLSFIDCSFQNKVVIDGSVFRAMVAFQNCNFQSGWNLSHMNQSEDVVEFLGGVTFA